MGDAANNKEKVVGLVATASLDSQMIPLPAMPLKPVAKRHSEIVKEGDDSGDSSILSSFQGVGGGGNQLLSSILTLQALQQQQQQRQAWLRMVGMAMSPLQVDPAYVQALCAQDSQQQQRISALATSGALGITRTTSDATSPDTGLHQGPAKRAPALSHEAAAERYAAKVSKMCQGSSPRARSAPAQPASPASPRTKNPPARRKGRAPVTKESLTSMYRGVSQHRLTGRWEASIWVEKKQVYLGGYDMEEKAARAYDLAALRCKGAQARLNLGRDQYKQEDIDSLGKMEFKDLVAKLRRESSAFSRGKSKYRGVSGHKVATSFQRPWEARIGRFSGKKNVFLGLFETEEAAARQYDRALIISKGLSAKTNFDIKEYAAEARRLKSAPTAGERGGGQGKGGVGGETAGGGPGEKHEKTGSPTRAVPDLKEMLMDFFANNTT